MSPVAPIRPRLEYSLGGARRGPFLVFCNGLGALKETWFHQYRSFSRSRGVLTWNPRGIGRSELPDEPVSTRDLAADLVALLNQAGIYRAAFVGHSFGGRIVQELALGWPGRVAAVVLVSTSAGGPAHVPGDPAAHTLLRRAASLAPEEWSEGVMPHLFGAAYNATRSERLVRLARWWARAPQPEAALARQWAAWDAFDRSGDLHRIRCPALVVHGAADTLSPPDNGRFLAEHVPDARWLLLEGVGHSPHLEDPERFNAEVRAFLEDVGA